MDDGDGGSLIGSQIFVIIMVLIVLGITVPFIMNFKDSLSDEASCQESITKRNQQDLRMGNTIEIEFYSFKKNFPLKCQNHVITIKNNDSELTKKQIADEIAACWTLFGQGTYNIFPDPITDQKTFCYVCSRIHFTDEVKQFYIENPIDLQELIEMEYDSGFTYKDYLTNGVGNKHFSSSDFYNEDGFKVEEKEIYLPQKINPEKGDLLITLNSFVFSAQDTTTNNILVYHWNNGEILSVFSEPVKIQKPDNGGDREDPLCTFWDGYPA